MTDDATYWKTRAVLAEAHAEHKEHLLHLLSNASGTPHRIVVAIGVRLGVPGVDSAVYLHSDAVDEQATVMRLAESFGPYMALLAASIDQARGRAAARNKRAATRAIAARRKAAQ